MIICRVLVVLTGPNTRDFCRGTDRRRKPSRWRSPMLRRAAPRQKEAPSSDVGTTSVASVWGLGFWLRFRASGFKSSALKFRGLGRVEGFLRMPLGFWIPYLWSFLFERRSY